LADQRNPNFLPQEVGVFYFYLATEGTEFTEKEALIASLKFLVLIVSITLCSLYYSVAESLHFIKKKEYISQRRSRARPRECTEIEIYKIT